MEAITILSIESRIDISLPYLVYINKIVNEANPIRRKIHAKTQIVKEGIPAILYNNKFFVICMFRYILFFFNFINE